MAEWIKREDAIKIVEKHGLTNGSVLGRHTGLAEYIASEIAAIPAIDIKEAKHGHWLTWEEKFPGRSTTLKCHYGCYCSACGNYANHATTFCPHCGVKMEDEDDGETIH